MENNNQEIKGKNIVILLVDALRQKNLSLFGYNKETDKNMKELASENLLFKQHFSTSNATAPALTSILTAQYPPHHGIIHQLPYTKEEEMDKVEKIPFWLPSYLKTKGYETICVDWVGLWLKKDFDFYGERDEGQEETLSNSPFISAKETVDLAISRIKKSSKPFFLFTHFWDSHFPFPNTSYESNTTSEDKIKTLEIIKDEHEREYLRKRIANNNLNNFEDMVNKYDLAIKGIDIQIGRLCDFLKSQGLWEDTIFLVLGDHGDSLKEHEIFFNHAGLYDESILVPMIMHLPGFGKKDINEFSQHVDIIPTLFEYLGFYYSKENFEGVSLLPLIKENIPVREEIFAFDGLCEDIKTVRTKDKKLIIAKDGFCNLCKGSHHKQREEYNLLQDSHELKNIFSEKSELEVLFNKKNL